MRFSFMIFSIESDYSNFSQFCGKIKVLPSKILRSIFWQFLMDFKNGFIFYAFHSTIRLPKYFSIKRKDPRVGIFGYGFLDKLHLLDSDSFYLVAGYSWIWISFCYSIVDNFGFRYKNFKNRIKKVPDWIQIFLL